MPSYQDIIENQLKIIQEGDEILNADEFILICEAEYYRPPGEKWYSKHRSLVGTGSKIGAGISTILTLGIYGKYRQWTDKCRQTCHVIKGSRKDKCVAVCNMNASKRVVQLIKSNKGKLGQFRDPEQRKKAKKIVDRELGKWEARLDKYKSRVAAMSTMHASVGLKRK